MKLYLEKPKGFHFWQTVSSHGWRSLAPFAFDESNGSLSYVFSGRELKTPITAIITEEQKKLKIEISAVKLSAVAQAKILRDVRHILRFDDDLKGFYGLAKKHKEFAWIAKSSAGRLLRSPTVFEDLVKTICTTNCSWALTKNMTTNLVENLGAASENGKRAFPTPEAMASVAPEFYKDVMRAGYRAPFFTELAEKAASGKINPATWLNSSLTTKELKREMKTIKGVGEYAADNLLKLVGRYDGLALDSWLRSQFYKKHNGEKVCDDKQIEKFYERFGIWRGLVMWCDMTERWFA